MSVNFTTSLSTSAGWRMLSSPVSTTYASLLGPGWTQGVPGSDSPLNGTPNVRTFNGTSFVDVANLTTPIPAGQGFLYYHFNDDNYSGTPNASPTILSVTGTEHTGATVSVPDNGWALAGNPFASTLNWDAVTKNSVTGTVYVYDPAYTSLGSSPDVTAGGSVTGNYRAWNGTAGSLTSGLIAPFQGFWVESSGTGSSIVIEAADKSTGGTFRGKEVATNSFSVAVKGQGMQSEAFLEFSVEGDLGKDGKDAYKLRPFSDDFALLYSLLPSGTTLDINHLPLIQNELRIPLGLDVTRGGGFELFMSSNSLPDGWLVSVLDELTGVTTRLDGDTRYRFTETRMAKRGNAVSPEGPVKVLAATAPRFTLIIDPASSTSTPDAGRSTPDVFALEQNYPNPFNPSTVIRWQLAVGGKMRLSVYDVLGREVAVLVDGVMAQGSHSVNFDASAFTSGIYLYKLEAGGMTQVRRMTLVK